MGLLLNNVNDRILKALGYLARVRHYGNVDALLKNIGDSHARALQASVISKSFRDLQTHLGREIFESGKPQRLNALGRELAEKTLRMENEIDLLLRQENKWVSITGPATFLTYYLDPKLSTLCDQLGLKIQVGMNNTSDSLRAIQAKTVDIALIRLSALQLLTETDRKRLKYKVLAQIAYYWVVPKSFPKHRHFRKGTVRMAGLSGRGELMSAVNAKNPDIDWAVFLPNFAALHAFVSRNGQYGSLLPDTLAKNLAKDFHLEPLETIKDRKVAVVARKLDFENNPNLKDCFSVL
jgi:DNA-binding transcriptional LysR family regulator